MCHSIKMCDKNVPPTSNQKTQSLIDIANAALRLQEASAIEQKWRLCAQQLHDPQLKANPWRAADLAMKVGIPEKRLKDWVTRGYQSR